MPLLNHLSTFRRFSSYHNGSRRTVRVSYKNVDLLDLRWERKIPR